MCIELLEYFNNIIIYLKKICQIVCLMTVVPATQEAKAEELRVPNITSSRPP